MALTYAQFKTFILDMLWNTNNSDLTAQLDNLIRMADNELNRKLTIQRRQVTGTIAPEQENFSLPSDFYQMVSLTNLQPERQRKRGDMAVSTFTLIEGMRQATDSQYIEPFYYTERSATANTLYLVGPFSALNPGSFSLQYRTTVPDYAGTDASWLEDEYLDLYMYTVFKHTAIYLREDERLQQYAALMGDALASALDEDLRQVQFGGSPLNMQPHRHVPRTRRKV